ncbi:hypothetical protein ACL598_05875 [Bordetella bronchialis]|uniref:hypothetical protein n=1 Tax=Bordetella bronchialis TaxID=463025 RepID=UPI003D008AC9
MDEFISNVRTTHWALIATTATTLAFALAPRDADEYHAARLEAQFVASLSERQLAIDPFLMPHGISSPDTIAAKKLFIDHGIEVDDDFQYYAPILSAMEGTRLTFPRLATFSQDMRPPIVPLPGSDDMIEAVQRIKGRRGMVRCLDDTNALVSCKPVPEGLPLSAARVLRLTDNNHVDSDIPSEVRRSELFPDWQFFLTFGKNEDKVTYHAGQPTELIAVSDITQSPHERFRKLVRSNPLIAQARGRTRPLGRILGVVQAWVDKWCEKKLVVRNKSIELQRRRVSEDGRAALIRGDFGAWIKISVDANANIGKLARDYSESCLPGQNIMGLPHLDPVWLEIENLEPKAAVTHLYRKEKEAQNRRTIDLGGMRVEEASVRVVAPIACFAISLFLLSSLTMVRQRSVEQVEPGAKATADYPWMGLFSDPLSRVLTALTIAILPVVVPILMLLQLSEKLDLAFAMGVLFTGCTALVACQSMRIVRFLRLDRFPP